MDTSAQINMYIVNCRRNCSVNLSVPPSLSTLKICMNETRFFQSNNMLRFGIVTHWVTLFNLGADKIEPQSLELDLPM